MAASADDLFHPIQNPRVSAKIVTQFRAIIADQRFQPGDRLPPERDLAHLLGVGRSALREAMRSLESLRVVETRPGRGTFLLAAEPLTILPGAVGSPAAHAALLEARLLIEPQIAALAARRATPEEHGEGRHILAAQAAHVAAGRTGTGEDIAFHRLLCRMARNAVLLQLHDSFADVLHAGRELVSAMPGRPLVSLREHEAILAAVEAREVDHAQERMAAHLTAVGKVLATVQGSLLARPTPKEFGSPSNTP
jgi:GntR family transcriptional regulator, transcriptional repressor for pyruvate dehydrogenase complex